MADSSGASTSSPNITAVVRDAQGHWTLDPAGSAVEFHVKHFWGAVTVHGKFEDMEGEGSVGADGTISGRLLVKATSVNTNNARRDKHLRSSDFFDAERYPTVTVTVSGLVPEGTGLRGRCSLETAGRSQDVDAAVEIVEATANAATLRAEVVVDRFALGMTWSPLGMASRQAATTITARFLRQ